MTEASALVTEASTLEDETSALILGTSGCCGNCLIRGRSLWLDCSLLGLLAGGVGLRFAGRNVFRLRRRLGGALSNTEQVRKYIEEAMEEAQPYLTCSLS